jgi:hypothetical protein
MMIGLGIDEPIDSAAARLKSLGVKNVGEVQRDQGGSFVHFNDPGWERALSFGIG